MVRWCNCITYHFKSCNTKALFCRIRLNPAISRPLLMDPAISLSLQAGTVHCSVPTTPFAMTDKRGISMGDWKVLFRNYLQNYLLNQHRPPATLRLRSGQELGDYP